jgi:hypothetical protein
MKRMEFSCCNDFSQFLHVNRLDVHNVEALIRDIQVPKVNSEIICRYVGFSIRIDGNGVDVVCVG